MIEELVPYSEGSDRFDAWIARPETPGPHPAVLVCHTWAGRNEFAEGRAKKLAELGYIAAAIDVYGIGQRGSDPASSQALMMPLIENPDILRHRLEGAFEAVHTLEGVDPDRVAVIGYCFGGLCAILCARMGLDLRGAVSFHGLLKIGEELEAKPRARILALHGQDDPMVSPEDIGRFAEEMKRIDADWQLHAYPGAVHAFTNPAANDPDFGMAYHAEADQRSWRTMRAFLEEVLA